MVNATAKPGAVPVMVLRVLAAALAGTMAGIHLQLYANDGYKHIPTIGGLFLFNGIAGSVLFLALLAAPRRLLPLVALASVGFFAGTIIGLIISVNGGLFGFMDSSHSPLFDQSLGVEAGGTLVGLVLTALAWRRRR